MTRKTTILILSASLLVGIFSDRLFAVEQQEPKLQQKPKSLREGTLIEAVNGQLIQQDQKWFFKFDNDVNDTITTIKAGTPFELLRSFGLQEMLDLAKAAKTSKFKIWRATVITYKNQNFLFPHYALPLSEPNTPPAPIPAVEPNAPETKKQKPSATDVDDPNDVLSIPAEIKKRLNPTRMIRPAQLKKLSTTERRYDSILADRTGFIVETDPNQFEFVFDAMGRNVEKISIDLLPCQILELAAQKQAEESDPVRYKVAGVVTQYKDKYYLLLQRAAPTYSHGNFSN